MPLDDEDEIDWARVLGDRHNLPKEAIEAALGFTHQNLMPTMLQFLVENLPQGISRDHTRNDIIEFQLLLLLSHFRPSSLQEALMAIHALAANQTAIDCLHRANEPDVSDEQRDRYLGHALRFMNASSGMNQALAKLRRGGNQLITVERVNVGDGGQAIVGNVETRGALPAPGNQPHRVSDARAQPTAIEHKRKVPLTPEAWLAQHEAAKAKKK